MDEWVGRLNGCKLSSEGTEALADTLRHLLQLTELGLDGNQFDNPTAGQALADSLSKMTALQRLSLNGCKLSSEGTEALANALHHLPQLTTLSLDGNQFDNPTAGQSLADSLSKMTALQRLSLNRCNLSSEGTEALSDTLRHLPQLTTLCLDGNRFDNPTAGQALADSLSKMTALQRLSLNACRLSSEGTEALADALHHLPQLTELGLDGNRFDNPTAGQTLADSLPKMAALQRLSLNRCNLSSEGTEALADTLRHLPQLTTLWLNFNQFDNPTTGKTLTTNVSKMTTLQTLSLNDCKLSGAGAEVLAIALCHLPQLTTLCLGGCGLCGTRAKAVAVALGHLPRLRTLNLNNNNFRDPGTDQTLVDNVSKMTELQTLSLQNCHIQAGAMKVLIESIGQLSALKELILSDIDTVDAKQLCRSLLRLSQLEKLRLTECHIDTTSEDAIRRVADNLPRMKFCQLY
ncbi:hypothetical protein LSAT2_000525 [Lamellibrachia satsuma]|nr:hypothetical protein LSAT2_000525 [Lamellibrachia satsuma]